LNLRSSTPPFLTSLQASGEHIAQDWCQGLDHALGKAAAGTGLIDGFAGQSSELSDGGNWETLALRL